MTADPLIPLLRAAAEAVLSRPTMAGHTGGAERFAADHRAALLDMLAQSDDLRRLCRERLRIPRSRQAERDFAGLLLHADPEVRAAAVRFAQTADGRQADATADRGIRRLRDRNKQLQERLRTATGRLDNALADMEANRQTAREAGERAERLDAELSATRRRLRDPASTASALLALLQEEPREPEGDSRSRDPHLRREPPPAPLPSPLETAARLAEISPESFARALRALIEPPVPSATVVVSQERDLRVVPLGGGTGIGGSCLLVEAGGTRVLIDAGLVPGDPSRPPADIGQALDGPLHAVVVTHAHNDHCGYVPALTDRLPDLRIIATPETTQLMPAMWLDSVKIMDQRRRLADTWSVDTEPLYPREAVAEASRRCEELAFGVPRRIGDLTVELFPAGHILGAAGVVVRAGESRVVITGDISGFRQESVDGYAVPESAHYADLLVMESTCCAENHREREGMVGELVRAVEGIYAQGGRVLIPAFALGRAQELALVMRSHLPHVPVLVDGMAADISRSFEAVTADGPHPLSVFGGNVGRARPGDMDRFTRGVVISTSGMLSGGPAVRWAAKILPDPKSALFLSGYQDEESPGRRLLISAQSASPHLIVDDMGEERKIPIRARVDMMRLSAHADRRGLLEIADEVSAHEVMLVHGEARRQAEFREVLRLRRHTTTGTGSWRVS
ncbi:MBL fold metallo-hydrolase [Streptosporangium saharense]|uniref:Cft2 family RNA processing exonuclease n=1 Tax=Streptosporangium saharense TaxID=1706840 RepID=A0A7W7VQM0_9ACTN|nr:MBL fold metallo-hydrolase [Streptosporangium saharense]MBB4919156.1 Cft2 family RNA processing exonuclease [Streptosporangium saharense]